jgi:hypothetical protein
MATTIQVFYRVVGERVHLRVFVGPYDGQMEEAGALVMRPVDFINLTRGAVQLDYVDEESQWSPPQRSTPSAS